MNLIADLVGTPYLDRGRTEKGADCWGIVKLVYERLGIGVPDYLDLQYSGRDAQTSAEAIAEAAARHWEPIERGSEQRGDVALFTLAGIVCHCGVVLSPGFMMHTQPEHDAVVERYDGTRYARRLHGFYRLA